MRKYKIVEPKVTIEKILNLLKQAGIEEKDILFENRSVNENINSTIVRLFNNKYMQQYGKGLTQDYSVASSLGELMERLQSLWFFSSIEDDILDLYKIFYTDLVQSENKMNIDEIHALGLPDQYIDGNPLFSLFYDVFNKKNVELPINFLLSQTGSTGFSAGNDYYECICQGIGEIIERYVQGKFFEKKVVPPEIKDHLLEKYYSNFHILTDLKKDFIYHVFDMSLGLNLPAVSLLIINKKTNSFVIQFACDTNFDYALDRCIIEAFQGYKKNDFEKIDYKLHYKKTIDYDIKQNCSLNKKTGLGYFDLLHIISNKPDYEVNIKYLAKNDFIENNYFDCLKYLFQLMKNLNKNIYIKDLNYLGFPTTYVFIPGISSDCENFHNFEFEYSEKGKSIISNLRNTLKSEYDHNKIDEFIINLEKCIREINKNLDYFFDFMYINPFENIIKYPLNIDIEYFVLCTLIYIMLQKYTEASAIMENYILKQNPVPNQFTAFLCDYLFLKNLKKFDDQEIINHLKFIYDNSFVDDFVEYCINKKIIEKIFPFGYKNKEFNDFLRFKKNYIERFKCKSSDNKMIKEIIDKIDRQSSMTE